MPSLRTSLILAAIAILGVHSQNETVPYAIDPDSVPLSTRQGWCQSQIAACPLLCLQNENATDSSTVENDCEPDTLDFSCICGNGITPDVNNFSQTLPFFECQEYGNQCVTACGAGNNDCEEACRADHPCGAQSPTRINVTTTSSTMAAGATSTGGNTVYNGLGGTSSSSNNQKSGSQAALDVGRSCGLTIVFAGLFVGFAFLM